MTPGKLINLNYLRQHTRSDAGLMLDMILIYLEQTPGLITAMKNGLQQKDWRLLSAAAHKLKPSFRIIGVPGKEAVAKQIQTFAELDEPNPELLGPLVEELANTCEIIYNELQDEIVLLKKSPSAER